MKQFRIVIEIENHAFPLHTKESMLRIEEAIARACMDNDSKMLYYKVDEMQESGCMMDKDDFERKWKECKTRIKKVTIKGVPFELYADDYAFYDANGVRIYIDGRVNYSGYLADIRRIEQID